MYYNNRYIRLENEGSITMLIRYKKAYEKIAMGLLSFMPAEKDIKKLTETIHTYEQNDHWNLYLWKTDDEFVALVGVSVLEGVATIEHISVIPSYRGEGVAREMLRELKECGLYKSIVPNEITKKIVEKCIPMDREADEN